MKTKPQPTTKRARPETMREARTWETVKNKYLNLGLCHACASQAAWGHQIGFSQTSHPPCPGCVPLVTALPKPQPNGWRSVEGRASDRRPAPAHPDSGPRDSLPTTDPSGVPGTPATVGAPEPLSGQPA